jgi:hypothetical protein
MIRGVYAEFFRSPNQQRQKHVGRSAKSQRLLGVHLACRILAFGNIGARSVRIALGRSEMR